MTAAISAFTPPVAPPPPAAPAAPPQGQNDFARMLSQQQAQAGAPEVAAAEPAGKTESSAKQAPAETQPAPPTVQATRDDATGRAEKPRSAATKNAAAKATKEAVPPELGTDGTAVKTDKAESIDPVVADWLSALNLPQATPAAPVAAAMAAAGGVDPAVADSRAAADASGPPRGGKNSRNASAVGLEGAAKDARRLQSGEVQAQAGAALRGSKEGAALPSTAQAAVSSGTSQAAAWQAMAEQAALPLQGGARKESSAVDAPGGASTAGSLSGPTAAPRGNEAAAPLAVTVPTPATSPEFPKALGVQVSLLARDGIQQAELHLHPAGMGPISVQIALDGTRAQVDFGADLAATRQIIEGSLPELAAAMRDAGLTLSGGSVNQQASGQHGSGSGSAPGGRRGSDAAGLNGDALVEPAAPRRAAVRMADGGVDLYA